MCSTAYGRGRFAKARASEIARGLGMSHRTLARRLALEGLTFSGILDELKVDLAKGYLKDGSLPISQIAWLLGYREVSAFTHAFKRWTDAENISGAKGFSINRRPGRTVWAWRTGLSPSVGAFPYRFRARCR
jgi:hypothetical protein